MGQPNLRTVNDVGLVGCGRMGREIARHLLEAGWTVTVSDPDPEARAQLVALGAGETGADAAAVAAASDLVLVAVVDDEQVREVVAGERGILAGARPGAVVAICASVHPALCEELSTLATGIGLHVIDVAMVGGERGAEAGSLTLFCGGDDVILQACRQVFAAFAISVCPLGSVGAGQVGKTANNILLWTALRADVEALRLARALGVDPARLRPAVAIGSGGNRPLLEWSQARLRWPKKDLEVALAMAKEAHVELPLVDELTRLMEELSAEDLHDLR